MSIFAEAEPEKSGEAPGPRLRMIVRTLLLTVLFALALGSAYLGYSLIPAGLQCEPAGANARCLADPVRLFGGSIQFWLPAETQMIALGSCLGGLGGFVGALHAHSQNISQFRPRLFGLATNMLVGALAGPIVYLTLRSGLVSSAAVLTDLNLPALAAVSLATGLAASRFVPQYIGTLARETMDLPAKPAASVPAIESGEIVAQAVQRLNDRIEALIAQPVLDNWAGRVEVEIVSPREPRFDKLHRLLLQPEERIELVLWFVPDSVAVRPPARTHWSERIEISGGNPEPDQVRFDLGIDAYGFRNLRSSSAVVEVKDWSAASSSLQAIAPSNAGASDLFVEVGQKGRLVQTLAVATSVIAGEGREVAKAAPPRKQ